MRKGSEKNVLNQILSLCDYVDKIKETDEYKTYVDEINRLNSDPEYQVLIRKIDKNAPDYHLVKKKIYVKEQDLRYLEKQINSTIYVIEKAIKEKL